MNNRRFARTAGWLALPCLVAAGLLAWYVTREPATPFEQEQAGATFEPALVSRGEYVARLSDCVACHSLAGKAPFAGGLEMATPLGAIHATNITPDKSTGIGTYSLADFDRAVRHGVAPGGRRLYPAMPYPSYVKLSDDDIKALYAFFMQGIKPANQPNIPSDIPWPLNMRWPIALWNGVFAPTATYAAKPDQDALWNRGAYIVQGPGHCGSCHTPRGLAFNEKALDDVGAAVPQGVLVGLGGVSRSGGEHAIPQRDGPAHIQRPGNITGDIRLVGRFYALHEKRVQRFYVVIAEFHVGRVGHGRIQPAAARCYAMAHRTVEVGQAVGADTRGFVRRDVGGVDRPQRRGHFQAPGERCLARQTVAGHAVAETGNILATADQGGFEGGARLFLFERRSRFTGDVPGQQACGDQAGQRQPACGSCESTVVHGRFLKVS
jgi:mono/diheme cytochrome c family protein